MSFYDPFGRDFQTRNARSRQQPKNQRSGMKFTRQPTQEDYYQLAQAYQDLESDYEKVSKDLETSQEALKQQTKKAIELREALDEAQETVAQLRQERETLVAAAEKDEAESEWEDRFLRLQAETENYRRRLEQRYAQEANEQRNQILRDMLPLADHLEMALKHAGDDSGGDSTQTAQSLRQSLDATLRAFLDTLKRYGVERMDAGSEPFDPNWHEAMGHVPSDSVPEDHVVEVLQTGYLAGDKLLRPARVLVSSGGEQ